jgi:glc operon protein GlcG
MHPYARKVGAMTTTRQTIKLTDEGALVLLNAAVDHARKMGVPQCIAIVDEGCNLMAFVRMDGSKFMSIRSSQRKAMTAASSGRPTGGLAADIETKLALATDGDMVNLKGGLPVMVEGQVIGGIGVGSGTGDQDAEVANAALKALPGAATF